jgi:predicted nucleic acid-binding protein
VSRLVLDNTVTMAWCFADESNEFSEALLRRLSDLTDSALVPALWLYEVVNVTELAVRKGRIAPEKAKAFLESLADLPIEIEHPSVPQMFTSVRMLTGQYGLTAYDAVAVGVRHTHDR